MFHCATAPRRKAAAGKIACPTWSLHKVQPLDSLSGSAQIRKAHFRIFARKDYARHAGAKGGCDRVLCTLRRTPAVIEIGRNVDVNAWPDQCFCPGSALNGSLRLAVHVVARKTGIRDLRVGVLV